VSTALGVVLAGCSPAIAPTTPDEGKPCRRAVIVSSDDHATRSLIVTVSVSVGKVSVDGHASGRVTGLVAPASQTAFDLLVRCSLPATVSVSSGTIQDVEELPAVEGDEQRYNVAFGGDESTYSTVGFDGTQRTVTIAAISADTTRVDAWTSDADDLLAPVGPVEAVQADYDRLAESLGSTPELDLPSSRVQKAEAAWKAGQSLAATLPLAAARLMLAAARDVGVDVNVLWQLEGAAEGMGSLTAPVNFVGMPLADLAGKEWFQAGTVKSDLLASGLRSSAYVEARPRAGFDATYSMLAAVEPREITFSPWTGSGTITVPLPPGWRSVRYVAPIAQR
jgi:hypothetical protein